jgi:hypothetical protein
VGENNGGLAPLQTAFIFFNDLFGKKETHMKNGENHMKEQNKSFQMVQANRGCATKGVNSH